MACVHPLVSAVLTGKFGVPADDVRAEASMADLEMDSLAMAEFALMLVEETGAEIDLELMHKDVTLAEISDLVATAMATGSAR